MAEYMVILDANDPENTELARDDSGKVRVFITKEEAAHWLNETMVIAWNALIVETSD